MAKQSKLDLVDGQALDGSGRSVMAASTISLRRTESARPRRELRLVDEISGSTAAAQEYARRHPGRTAREDGLFAVILAAAHELFRKDQETARNASHDLVRVCAIEPWAAHGLRLFYWLVVDRGVLANVSELAWVENHKLRFFNRTYDAIDRERCAGNYDASAVLQNERRLKYVADQLFHIDQDGLRPWLEPALRLGKQLSEEGFVGPLTPREFFERERWLHVREMGRVLPARRRGQPIDEVALVFFDGLKRHFTANRFGVPTATDAALLSVFWRIDPGTVRLSRDRWEQRIDRHKRELGKQQREST